MRLKQKKDKTETATGLGGRTREDVEKWSQMTALRFQTRGDIRHEARKRRKRRRQKESKSQL